MEDIEKVHFKIIGTHTDSPLLKIAPRSRRVDTTAGFEQINVQVYGGGLWQTWFDRDISFAGRIVVIDKTTKKLTPVLWESKHALMRIPSLAPHLKTDKNNWSWNNEQHLRPVICTSIVDDLFNNEKGDDDFEMIGEINHVGENPYNLEKNHLKSLLDLIATDLSVSVNDIVDFELTLIDDNTNLLMGLHEEFVSSERLDNMFCTMNAMNSLAEYHEENKGNFKGISILGCYDHEEVGSRSMHGAASNQLIEYMERILYNLHPDATREDYYRAVRRSFFSSNDVGHGVHPNYPEAH